MPAFDPAGNPPSAELLLDLAGGRGATIATTNWLSRTSGSARAASRSEW